MKAVIVCGDRHGRFSDWLKPMRIQLDAFRRGEHCVVIHGDQHGVDKIASYLCRSLPDHYAESRFPVSKSTWRTEGRGSGPDRNERMAGLLEVYQELGAGVKVFGFHGNYEKSRGTRNMLKIAKEMGFPYVLFESPDMACQLELAGIGAGGATVADRGTERGTDPQF